MAIWRALRSERRTRSETDKSRQVQMPFLNLELAFQKHPLCLLHCFTNKGKKLFYCVNIYGNLCLLFLHVCVCMSDTRGQLRKRLAISKTRKSTYTCGHKHTLSPSGFSCHGDQWGRARWRAMERNENMCLESPSSLTEVDCSSTSLHQVTAVCRISVKSHTPLFCLV